MSDDVDDFAATLGRLTPTAAWADPVAAAYAAGRAAGRRGVNRCWVGAAFAATAAAAVVLWQGPLRPGGGPPMAVPVSVAASLAASVPATPPAVAIDPWALRSAVLARGLDGIPPAHLPVPRPFDRFDPQ